MVVEGTECHAKSRPGVEVVGGGDSAAGALGLTNRPVLLEGCGTLDRRLVGAGGLVDVVGSSVRSNRSLLGGACGGVVSSEIFNDIVFDKGRSCPAVDGKITVAVWVVATRECNISGRSRVPSLSSNKVPTSSPGYAVFATSQVGVGNIGTTISPERIIITIIRASRARCATLFDQIERSSEDTCDSRQNEKRRECDHFDLIDG